MKTFCHVAIQIGLCLILISTAVWGETPNFGKHPGRTEQQKTKQALVEEDGWKQLERRKKITFQEIQRQLQLIDKYKKSDAQYPDSIRLYDSIAKKYKKFEKLINGLKDPDELGAVLQRCEFHECADLDDRLSRERTKNEIPRKLEELDLNLGALKKISGGLGLVKKDLQMLSLLSDKISNIKKSLVNLPKPVRKDEVLMNARNLWRENRSEIRILRMKLSKMNRPQARQTGFALTYFTLLINALESPATVATVASTTISVPVLYIHWSDNPPEISDRAELDEGLRQIQESIRQFSYGTSEINFTVCEAAGGSYPEGDSYFAYQEAIRLCDPQLDYIGEDGEGPLFMLFYPLHGIGKTWPERSFDTEEAAWLMVKTTKPSWGEFDINEATHEIGHAAWDLEHAHSLECDSFVYGGTTCRQGDDYGDYFDTMGHNIGHFNAKYKEKIGWLIPTLYSLGQNTYRLRPLESNGTGDIALKLPVNNSLTEGVFEDRRAGSPYRRVDEPCDDLYIEYRRPITGDDDEHRLNNYIEAGFVDPEGGLALHCATTEPPDYRHRLDGSRYPVGGTHSWLLDCSPESRITRSDDVRDSLIRPGERCDVSRLGYIVTFQRVLPDHKAEVFVEQACTFPSDRLEECDNVDNNCNGTVDEGCNDDGDWHCDASIPIFGSPSICPRGGGDCDDNDSHIHPGGTEYCDGRDNNCDGSVNEGGICPEICDGIDNDEDGQVDEECNHDGDGYCDTFMPVVGRPSVCPSGGGDCDDNNASINPGSAEICDGIDNNCLRTVAPGAGLPGSWASSGEGWVDEGGVCPPPSCTDSDRGNNPEIGGIVVTSTPGRTPATETLSDFCDEDGWKVTEYVCRPIPVLSGSVGGGGSMGYPISAPCPPGLWCINPGGGLPAYCGEE